MKSLTKLFFVAVFLIFCGFAWLNQSQAETANLNQTNFFDSKSSRGLFINNCARCHGADGKSQTTLGKLNDAPDISGGRVRKWSSKRLTNLIKNGEGSMPAFGRKLSRAQIASLVSYVRGL